MNNLLSAKRLYDKNDLLTDVLLLQHLSFIDLFVFSEWGGQNMCFEMTIQQNVYNCIDTYRLAILSTLDFKDTKSFQMIML